MKNTPILQNLKFLKEDMESKGWVIEAFTFEYKKKDYIVLVKLYVENEEKPEYALLKLEFIDSTDFNNTLIVSANSSRLMVDPKTLREFFNINYASNLGDILQQFYQQLSGFIPIQVNPHQPDNIKSVMISSLSKSDSQDPNKIYCFKVKRNPNNDKRSLYNDNKTKLLRPALYAVFKEERSISFCYSLHKENEKTDEEILLNFGKKK